MQLASSHSAPAVSSAMRVTDTPRRRAVMAVWSTNLSAPMSSKTTAAMKVAVWKHITLQSIVKISAEVASRPKWTYTFNHTLRCDQVGSTVDHHRYPAGRNLYDVIQSIPVLSPINLRIIPKHWRSIGITLEKIRTPSDFKGIH